MKLISKKELVIETFYTKKNSGYLSNNPSWHTEDSPWKARQILKMIKKNGILPKTVSEIGCGAGEILNQLYINLPNDTKLTGFEIAIDAFQLCKQKEKNRLEFKDTPLEKIAERFDLLLIIDVFEHVEDYLGFIKNCKAIAKYKIFHIPLDITAHEVITDKLIYHRNTVGHLHYFTKQTAIATLKDCGYEIIDWFYTPWLDLAKNNFQTMLLLLPRKIMHIINKDFGVRLFGGYSLMVLAK